MISIRAARPEDAATLVALGATVGREPEAWLLNTDGWRSVTEERRYIRALKRHPDAAVFVAEDDGAIVGRLSIARDPHTASRHVADLGLMVAAEPPPPRHRARPARAGGLLGARRRHPQARAARLPLERAGDQALRAVRLRARGAPQGPLPPRRRVRRRDPDGVLARRLTTPAFEESLRGGAADRGGPVRVARTSRAGLARAGRRSRPRRRRAHRRRGRRGAAPSTRASAGSSTAARWTASQFAVFEYGRRSARAPSRRR